MVSITQIQNGLAAFIGAEIEPKISGVGKWLVGAAAAAYIAELPQVLQKLNANPFMSALNIVAQDGSVDLDKLFKYLHPAAQKAPATLDIPLIGRLTLSAADVEALYSYIMRA